MTAREPDPQNAPPELDAASPGSPSPVLFGRSSSHFTRVTRIMALELGVPLAFRIIPNLLSTNPADYGGNPALRLPVLHTEQGQWFGALNICRVLERTARAASARLGRGPLEARIVWPEDLAHPLSANAQELSVQAMSTEVALIMARVAKADEATPNVAKQRESLERMLAWLERHADAALAELPAERALSFLELTLFCLVTHLEFREILPIAPYRALGEFCRRFGERASARETAFRFD